MANRVIYSSHFIRKAKDLNKKHLSFKVDLEALEQSLIANPKQGDNLGAGLYKVRLAVKSKGKGKRGGYRVITYLVSEANNDIVINMLTVYDKSEESSIDKPRLLKSMQDIL
ncbi:type II toxin-antitoxin system RelE/ParE family toxin [Mucilaginibacter sp. L3T2-6]|uniref:type II toxin-antitoxin system RelE/ParE family toxin n=1 Tax=Mucilaginibacter sp. L3T2-6 TaxID=3062491 RepID=UPI0026768675|nr:type II toxin-antitoxin system RelE/ParE family toxin [Mucilaginibacter sp. L3T2-6]MDO3641572.1 type II toxin-antitoxin system RelE/ParE family toxin [Mucilaginibacter sp. L3T2-6]MDV6214066.1 type II toxin-antitoxin system RelE/ParE family toxin [Mucilaginibacter sp. L3T2-6]